MSKEHFKSNLKQIFWIKERRSIKVQKWLRLREAQALRIKLVTNQLDKKSCSKMDMYTSKQPNRYGNKNKSWAPSKFQTCIFKSTTCNYARAHFTNKSNKCKNGLPRAKNKHSYWGSKSKMTRRINAVCRFLIGTRSKKQTSSWSMLRHTSSNRLRKSMTF